MLVAVSGRGPSSGNMTLFADGAVARWVEYRGVDAQQVIYQIGTFRVDAQGLAFSLREAISSSSYEWPVRGTWDGQGFSIRYADPGDGPDIVETYRRR